MTDDTLCALLDTSRATGNGDGPDTVLRRARQDLARAKAELGQFAHITSHDFREPARLIAGYVQLLARSCQGKLGAEADDLIASVLEGVSQMQERIDGMLQYARVTSAAGEFQPVCCQEALTHAIAGLRETIEQTGAEITYGRLLGVLGDPVQIQTVFHHLISNALTFRSETPPRVHVTARPAGGEWTFALQDNGIGIAAEHSERIFMIFQRLHTKLERPGAGVGLAVARSIVERHGGRIWVESEAGRGATFCFTLPQHGGEPVTGDRPLGTEGA